MKDVSAVYYSTDATDNATGTYNRFVDASVNLGTMNQVTLKIKGSSLVSSGNLWLQLWYNKMMNQEYYIKKNMKNFVSQPSTLSIEMIFQSDNPHEHYNRVNSFSIWGWNGIVNNSSTSGYWNILYEEENSAATGNYTSRYTMDANGATTESISIQPFESNETTYSTFTHTVRNNGPPIFLFSAYVKSDDGKFYSAGRYKSMRIYINGTLVTAANHNNMIYIGEQHPSALASLKRRSDANIMAASVSGYINDINENIFFTSTTNSFADNRIYLYGFHTDYYVDKYSVPALRIAINDS